MSSKFIPGNEKAIGRMINNLFKQGAEVLYEAVHDIHVSGHATRPELKRMIELVQAQVLHSDPRRISPPRPSRRRRATKRACEPENVVIAVNGDVIELTRDSFEIVEHLEEHRVLVEGREGNDISKLVLKERRQMGEKGIVFSLLVRNAETRRIIAGPRDHLQRPRRRASMEGLPHRGGQEARAARSSPSTKRKSPPAQPEMDLQETIRVELRRFFNSNIGKKPTVLPIILDM